MVIKLVVGSVLNAYTISGSVSQLSEQVNSSIVKEDAVAPSCRLNMAFCIVGDVSTQIDYPLTVRVKLKLYVTIPLSCVIVAVTVIVYTPASNGSAVYQEKLL
jgi:hypothetical protein